MMDQENYSYALFNVRLDKERYEIVKKWWQEKKWSVPSIDSLSTTGVMIYYHDKPICAGWLYQTDSLMAVIGFIIADLTIGKTKKNSMKFLLKKLEEIAKQMGFKSVFMPVAADSIAKLSIKELGYLSSGKTNELAKII